MRTIKNIGFVKVRLVNLQRCRSSTFNKQTYIIPHSDSFSYIKRQWMSEILNIWCIVGIDTTIYIPHLMFKLCIRFNHHYCKNCWWMMTLIRKVKFMIAVYSSITYSIKYFIDKSSTNEVLKWRWLHGCKISRKTRNGHIFWRMSRWLSNSRN